MAKNVNNAEKSKNASKKKTANEERLEKRVKELEALVAEQKKQIDELLAGRAAIKAAMKAPAAKAAKAVKKATARVAAVPLGAKAAPAVRGIDSEGREIVKTKRSKYKCATTGKYTCDKCGAEIDRGDTIRFVSVKFADGTREHYQFCSGKHRNAYCDGHGIPLDAPAK